MPRLISDYTRFPLGLPIAGSIVDPDSLGYVYVIGPEDQGVVKIGSTGSLSFRLSELQCGSWLKLKVFAAVSIYSGRAFDVEFAAHKIAVECGERLSGEWFALEPMDALRCIIEAAKSKRVRYGPAALATEAIMSAANDDSKERERERVTALRRKLGMD